MNKELKKALIDEGLTASEFASRIGISEAYFSLIINGHKNGYPIREKIAKALNASYEALWIKTA